MAQVNREPAERNPRENVPAELKYQPVYRYTRYTPRTGKLNRPAVAALRARFGWYGMVFDDGVVARRGYRFGPSKRMSLEVITADYVCLYDSLDVAKFWIFGQLDEWGSGEGTERARVIPAGRRRTVSKYIDQIESALREADPIYVAMEIEERERAEIRKRRAAGSNP